MRKAEMGSVNRKRRSGTKLLLALGAAVMCVLLLRKLREGRIASLILQERESQLLTLQILFQKEKERSEEMKRKFQKTSTRAISLRAQKMEITSKLLESQSMVAYLKEKQRDLELDLEKKQREIERLAELEAHFIQEKDHVADLTKLLSHQEAQLSEMKHRLDNLPTPPENSAVVDVSHPTNETSVSQGGEEGTSTNNEQLEGIRFSGDNKEITGDNEQQQDSIREQWVRLETNEGGKLRNGTDDEGADGQEKGKVQGDALKKQEVSLDAVQHEEGDETGHGNAENLREENNSKTPQQIDNEREVEITKGGDEAGKSNIMAVEEQEPTRVGQLEKTENSQGGEEQASSNDDKNFEMSANRRIRGRHQKKIRKRRQRVAPRGRKSKIASGQDEVKDTKAKEDRYALANELSENPHNDESLPRTGEHANNMWEESTKEDGSNGRSELPSNSHGDGSPKIEGKKEDSPQDSNEDRSPAENRNSQENEQEAVSSSRKQEVPKDTQDGEQSTARSTMEEKSLSTEWQPETSQKPNEGALSVNQGTELHKSVQKDKVKEWRQPEKEVEGSNERSTSAGNEDTNVINFIQQEEENGMSDSASTMETEHGSVLESKHNNETTDLDEDEDNLNRV